MALYLPSLSVPLQCPRAIDQSLEILVLPGSAFNYVRGRYTQHFYDLAHLIHLEHEEQANEPANDIQRSIGK